MRAAPAVSCATCTEESAHEHTGPAEAIRPSLRDGFTAYFALSPVTGFLATVTSSGLILLNLAPAPGRQDHTTSPSAEQSRSSVATIASTASRGEPKASEVEDRRQAEAVVTLNNGGLYAIERGQMAFRLFCAERQRSAGHGTESREFDGPDFARNATFIEERKFRPLARRGVPVIHRTSGLPKASILLLIS